MEHYIGKYSPYFYATLRMVSGVMFAMHGFQKLTGWPGENPPVALDSLMGVAGSIETLGGLCIIFGFYAGWAAFITSGEMAVAYFKVHAPQAPLPLLNKGELAVLYCFLFLYIASKGSGVWSIDSLLKKKRKN